MSDEEPTMPGVHDEVALPHFEDRLEQALGGLHDERGRTGGGRTAHRHRRWSLRLAGTVAAAAAAAVALGTVGGVGPSSTGERGIDSTASTGAPERPVVSLEAEVASTMRRIYADSVVHTTSTRPAYLRSEDWTDYVTGAHRMRWFNEDGSVKSDTGVVRPADPAEPAFYRTVDHCTRQYTEEVKPISSVEILRDNADWWLDVLDQGGLVEDGTETLDGRELVRFRFDPQLPATYSDEDRDGVWESTDPDESPVYTGNQRILVDPDTYELVRMVTEDELDGGQFIEDYEFLDRTPETAALATIPIPPGYTEVGPEGALDVDGTPTTPVAC
jgi:hypothetical protein